MTRLLRNAKSAKLYTKFAERDTGQLTVDQFNYRKKLRLAVAELADNIDWAIINKKSEANIDIANMFSDEKDLKDFSEEIVNLFRYLGYTTKTKTGGYYENLTEHDVGSYQPQWYLIIASW